MENRDKHFQGLEKYCSQLAETALFPAASEVCHSAGPDTATHSASSLKAVMLTW